MQNSAAPQAAVLESIVRGAGTDACDAGAKICFGKQHLANIPISFWLLLRLSSVISASVARKSASCVAFAGSARRVETFPCERATAKDMLSARTSQVVIGQYCYSEL